MVRRTGAQALYFNPQSTDRLSFPHAQNNQCQRDSTEGKGPVLHADDPGLIPSNHIVL